ncbi:MAG: hypothetical protein JXR48_17480 [Candidatus Delongbacteria bacterium]|nr:hypothetical protein [Candidatus Delongbacteria bacterium]
MKKHFVTYANEKYIRSANRLASQVASLSLFDTVKVYTPTDLPTKMTESWLYNLEKGAGYWVWKPYVVLETLKNVDDNDIVVYIDAGSEAYLSEEWNLFFKKLEDFNAVFFRYKASVYQQWVDYFTNFYGEKARKDNHEYGKAIMRNWTKKETIDFFRPYFDNEDWLTEPKYNSTAFLLKKSTSSIKFIGQWLDFMQLYPHLVVDPFDFQIKNELSYFIDHRHDLTILSFLLMLRKENDFFVMEENIELKNQGQAFFASRIKDVNMLVEKPIQKRTFFSRIKRKVKEIL